MDRVVEINIGDYGRQWSNDGDLGGRLRLAAEIVEDESMEAKTQVGVCVCVCVCV